MVSARILSGALLSCAVVSSAARHAPMQHAHRHLHNAADIGRRQEYSPSIPESANQPYPVRPESIPPEPISTRAGVLTYITPSPGASLVAVTKESQLVAAYVPQFTLCELPPIAFYNITTPPVSGSTALPSYNYSISTPTGTGACSTIYSPTMTQVCATTLTALATKYTVSKCHQDLTFSTVYGAVLVTPSPYAVPASNAPIFSNQTATASAFGTALVRRSPSANGASMITPAPSIETLTTYYIAPWQELTAGTAPRDVDLEVCRTFTNNDATECIRQYEMWSTSLVTKTTTIVTSVNISTTVHGLSQIIVETYVANVTEMLTTFSLSTTIDKVYQTIYTSTHRSHRKPVISTSTEPTVYETFTVQLASKTSTPSSDITSTTTIRSTSTVYAGTSTITLSSGQLPPIPTSTPAAPPADSTKAITLQ